MNEFLKKSAGIGVITFCFGILLAGIGIVYYFMLYIPNQAKESKQQLDECLSTAQDNYNASWAADCKSLENSNPSCSLPGVDADTYNAALKQDQDNCFKEYPQH